MFREPRQKNAKHLAFIRTLECLACGDNTSVEACHVRSADASIGKDNPGTGAKPDDAYTLPLCSKCHRMQHEVGEKKFWWMDACKVALALFSVTGDINRAMVIVRAAQR